MKADEMFIFKRQNYSIIWQRFAAKSQPKLPQIGIKRVIPFDYQTTPEIDHTISIIILYFPLPQSLISQVMFCFAI